MELVFDNEHFVAADKPAGWLSVPSRLGERDARSCLGRELEKSLGARLWPVHRLDEEASGIILFARDAPSHAEASRWFEHRLVTKTYEALTGIPASGLPAGPRERIWQSRLLRGKRRAYESSHGKPATTRAVLLGEVDANGSPALAWTLEPITGRSHQLRYELALHVAPILGDVLYGAASRLPGAGAGDSDGDAIALRCVRLEFDDESGANRLGLPAHLQARSLADWLVARSVASGPSVHPPQA